MNQVRRRQPGRGENYRGITANQSTVHLERTVVRETLRAMSAGEISGERAYLGRRPRLKASLADMMMLQSLNTL